MCLLTRASSAFGKRGGQHLVAQVTGRSQSRLLYVWDRHAGHKFLVDTGAQVSVFPASAQDRRGQKTEPLVAANGSQIDTFGKRTISFDLGFRKFQWSFVLANVNRPMLGADFFCSPSEINAIKGSILVIRFIYGTCGTV